MTLRIRKVAVLVGTAALFGAPAAAAAAADDQGPSGDTPPAQLVQGGGAPSMDDASSPDAVS